MCFATDKHDYYVEPNKYPNILYISSQSFRSSLSTVFVSVRNVISFHCNKPEELTNTIFSSLCSLHFYLKVLPTFLPYVHRFLSLKSWEKNFYPTREDFGEMKNPFFSYLKFTNTLSNSWKFTPLLRSRFSIVSWLHWMRALFVAVQRDSEIC